MSMSYIDRMRVELYELEGRISKLDDFIQGEEFCKLMDVERYLLEEQLSFMEGYRKVLSMRLELSNSVKG